MSKRPLPRKSRARDAQYFDGYNDGFRLIAQYVYRCNVCDSHTGIPREMVLLSDKKHAASLAQPGDEHAKRSFKLFSCYNKITFQGEKIWIPFRLPLLSSACGVC